MSQIDPLARSRKRVFNSVFAPVKLSENAPTPLATPILSSTAPGRPFGSARLPKVSSYCHQSLYFIHRYTNTLKRHHCTMFQSQKLWNGVELGIQRQNFFSYLTGLSIRLPTILKMLDSIFKGNRSRMRHEKPWACCSFRTYLVCMRFPRSTTSCTGIAMKFGVIS